MGMWDERFYMIGCDDCDDDTVEGDFGDIHFDTEADAIAEARKQGYQVTGDTRYPDVVCPLCIVRRVRQAAGKPEPVPQIPGQLDLLAAVM